MSATVTQLPARVLGGSDAAAAAGIDPYCSPVMLWLYKTGRVEREETSAMRWGKLLEPVIVDALREDGYDATRATELAAMPHRGMSGAAIDPARAWLTGHPDGFVTLDGATAVLEVKTANQWAHAANGDVPIAYNAQAQVYMHLTGLPRTLLACLVGGQRLELRTIERDAGSLEILLALMESFVGYVQRDEPPPVDGSASSKDALGLMHPEHEPGKIVRADRALQDVAYDLRARKHQAAVIAEQVRELENTLKAGMGDAEQLIGLFDQPLASWKSTVTRRVDVTELKKQRPELAEMFTVATPSRRFTVA